MMYRVIFLLFLILLPITVSAAPPANRGALPEPILTAFRTFAIPFEVLPNNSADPSNEVELLVSTDQGKKWFSAGKTGIEAKQFRFKAENDGEYWFSFRTITLSGAVKQSSASPQLRVIVQPSSVTSLPPQPDGSVQTAIQSQTAQTTSPPPVADAEIQSLKQNKPEYGSPLSPPKPMRLEEAENKKKQLTTEKAAVAPQVANSVNPAASPKVSLSEKYRQMPLLSTATGDVIKPDERVIKKDNNESVPVEELFSRLNQFYGGKLAEEAIVRVESREQTADSVVSGGTRPAFPVVSGGVPPALPLERTLEKAGKITGVSTNTSGTQIIIRWNRGEEIWGEAAKGIMADVLRGKTPQGPWLPLTTNLKNSGEYWWYVSQDDLTPFYLMIRLRTLDGIVAADFTPSPIQINPPQ